MRRKRPQIICPLCHIQQPQSSGLPFLRDTTPYCCGLCSRWPRSRAGELMKRSMGLLFLLIIQARVTAVSVIEPVMIIWFHQAGRIKRTHLFKSGESVELRSVSASSLWRFSQSMPGASQGFPHWTQRGCEGAKQGLPTEATMTLERGVGPNGQPESHSETGFTITSAILFLHQHAAIRAQSILVLFQSCR